jgi:hypothetical protein
MDLLRAFAASLSSTAISCTAVTGMGLPYPAGVMPMTPINNRARGWTKPSHYTPSVVRRHLNCPQPRGMLKELACPAPLVRWPFLFMRQAYQWGPARLAEIQRRLDSGQPKRSRSGELTRSRQLWVRICAVLPRVLPRTHLGLARVATSSRSITTYRVESIASVQRRRRGRPVEEMGLMEDSVASSSG